MIAQQVLNGVNVNELMNRIRTVKSDPELGRCRFRAHNRWIDGGHNRSKIKDFFAAGEEDHSRTKPFVLEADEPPLLLGEDQAANPVEFLLHALAACLTTSLVYHAASRGIELAEVESTVEGDLDLRGFMGISTDVRRGYQNIRVSFRVKSNATPEKLRELCEYSPVYDTIANPVPVSIQIEVK